MTKTFFSRTAMPNNLLTVAEWRRWARSQGIRTSGIMHERAALDYATRVGGALILKADDTLVCITRLMDSTMRRTVYAPGTWDWEAAQ